MTTPAFGASPDDATTTRRVYLSGRGADDPVQWEFFCTDGQNSGRWTTIGVPSCWELQGFGKYQYGIGFYGKAFPEGIAAEQGLYKYRFSVPEQWRGQRITLVFEASMTDTQVKINGRKAGSTHQGAFYRFSYDITDLLRYGDENLLEATVSKESSNASVNLAERRADYWNFGGIFRPVFLEINPPLYIQHLALDARADGAFSATAQLSAAPAGGTLEVTLTDAAGKTVAQSSTPVAAGADHAEIALQVTKPSCWTAETPTLYHAQFRLRDVEGRVLHRLSERFGFRTIEVRPGDGLYLNGTRITIRGVNRHSFRPQSGRTLSFAKNLEDVRLIKAMNMNAVRLSHYPADPDFFRLCDSLGLYVMDELGGWHGKYDTPTGIKLVEEMVRRDVNHPSIIWWSNGNEKGWNTQLDGEFHKYDPQRRPVLHPQGNFGGFETMHYRSYGESQEYMRLPELWMPTEFLHGLYDGGGGAGLYDYWEVMRRHPRTVGGFLWMLADEGVVRTDLNGIVDNQGNYGADGLVGPHHEPEGSFFTVKEVWCPVQPHRPADGTLRVENRYDFLNLKQCAFSYQYVTFPPATAPEGNVEILSSGKLRSPDVAPHSAGTITLPQPPDRAEALLLTAVDVAGDTLYRWSYRLGNMPQPARAAGNQPEVDSQTDSVLILAAGGNRYSFSKQTGYLTGVKTAAGRTLSFGSGPRFIAARRADRSLDQFYNHDDADAKKKERTYTEFTDAAQFAGFQVTPADTALVLTAAYRLGNLRQARWSLYADGALRLDYLYGFDGVVELMGIRFDYPESMVRSKTWLGDGPYRVWQNRTQGVTYNLWQNDYNDPVPGESFTYPEFKGYFAHVSWMNLFTREGEISLTNLTPHTCVGIYQPRDGRDRLLYTLPESGISLLHVIPAVRNKVNTTDLIGPSSQPKWVQGEYAGAVVLRFR
ncbi:MAG: DUF4981 domain-containing protein [Prevotellaceae bacterium]|nr:DUF4981 domain-containing protein [Prevotellaceae bacterium]